MKKLIYLLAGTLGLMGLVPNASAISGYSRQTDLACNACHAQVFPALNELGRSFKAAGYTMMGTQKKIEGSEGLSLPETLNASVVTKIRYQKTNGVTSSITNTTNNGQLQFPDELLLIVGGRVSENIGAQVELNLKSKDKEPVVENFKMPFIYDVSGTKSGVVLFTTASQGVSYGFELLNTGAVRGGRIMESRKTISAQQYINTGSAAEGVAVVSSNSLFFANISKWSPRSVGAASSGSPTANYLRLAITPSVGSWDTGLGVQSWSGSATTAGATLPTLTDTKAYAVDAQAQGEVGSMPLGIYLTYANAAGTETGGNTNLFNSNTNAMTALSVAAQLGVVPGKATLLFAYRKGDTGAASNSEDNALLIGGAYMLAQNMKLELSQEMYSGSNYSGNNTKGDQLTQLMLFAAF